jgi:uncharacterized membrane protein
MKRIHTFLLVLLLLWSGQVFPACANSFGTALVRQIKQSKDALADQTERPLRIAVLPFQDDGGSGASVELREWLAEDLSIALNRLATRIGSAKFNRLRDNSGNPVSTSDWEIRRLLVHGQKIGAQFVIRPGLLDVAYSTSYGITEVKVKAYAEVIAVAQAASRRVETLQASRLRDTSLASQPGWMNPRAEDYRNSRAYRVFQQVIEALVLQIRQTIEAGSFDAEPAEPPAEIPANDPAVDPQAAAGNPSADDIGATEEAQNATLDEELQQLIAQAQECLNGVKATNKKVEALIAALVNLQAALERKAQFLEGGNLAQAEQADQQIVEQRQRLQNAEADILPAPDDGTSGNPIPDEQGQSPGGSRWDTWFTRITQAADFALNFIDKIRQMRAQYREISAAANPGAGLSPDDPLVEGFETIDGNLRREADSTQGRLRTLEQRFNTPILRPQAAELGNSIPPVKAAFNGRLSPAAAEAGFLSPPAGRYQPLIGAEVIEPVSGLSTRTNGSGYFSFRVPARSTRLIIKEGGREVAQVGITIVRGRGATADVTVRANSQGGALQSARVLPPTVAASREQGNVGTISGSVHDALGRPVARLAVDLQGLAVARTDSQGKFTFTKVPAGIQRIAIQSRNGSPNYEAVRVAADRLTAKEFRFDPGNRNAIPREAAFAMGAGTVIRGVALDEQNRALGGAQVSALAKGKASSVVSLLTRADGSFELKDLKPGEYRIAVDKAGFDNAVQDISLRAGSTERLRMVLRGPSGATLRRGLEETIKSQLVEVRGQVRAPDRLPLANAIVEALPAAKTLSPSRVLTNARGEYLMRIFPGRFELRIKRNGYQEVSRPLTIGSRNSLQEDFELRPLATKGAGATPSADPRELRATGQLTGRVIDEGTGKPIVDALVSIGARNASTDSQGRYALSNLEQGKIGIVVTKAGYGRENRIVEIRAGNTAHQDFALKAVSGGHTRTETGKEKIPDRGNGGTALRATAEVTVRVSDDRSGLPLAEALVSVEGKPYRTDRSGRCVVTLDPGKYRIAAGKNGYESKSKTLEVKAGRAQTEDFKLQRNSVYEDGDSKVRNVGQIMGRVVDDKTGRPIPYATVSVAGRNVRTDLSGNYLITNLEAGKYRLSARAQGFESADKNLEIKPGSPQHQDFKLRLIEDESRNHQGQSKPQPKDMPGQQYGELTGRVTDERTGRPIAGALVYVQGQREVTDRSGNYSIANLRSGNQDVIISGNGYRNQRERVKIEAGRRSRGDFRLSPVAGFLKR